jgi:bifunctional UDP-N-acetylglucosamine pyrophosphorylase/glucosamine-1-phosphate N-acetyltransferase
MPRPSEVAVLVLAAGKSRRIRSSLSKVLHPLWGVPVLRHVLEACSGLGPASVVVSPGAEDVRAALPAVAKAVTQPRALGTGHAVLCARRRLNGYGHVAVLAGDSPLLRPATLKSLVHEHLRRGNAATFLAAEMPDPRGYGRVLLDGRGGLARMVEERDALASEKSIRTVNAGAYVFRARDLWPALGRLNRRNRQKEFYLPDALLRMKDMGLPVGVRMLEDWTEALGVNTRSDLARAHEVLRWRKVEALMKEGVTFLDPRTAYVSPQARLGRDCVVEPSVFIGGATRIAPGCRIGMGCHIASSRLGAGAVIKPYSVLEEAVVGERATVGPFARLRPGTHVGAEARIGNFVETKKAVLGRGAKASHLSYIGDAVVGDGANIGAGVITCNYDGVHKNRTVVGNGAFVGSDVQLVAPVKVGRGAYVGAGSTVTKDVPAGALAVSRAEQRNIEGWAKRRAGRRQGKH